MPRWSRLWALFAKLVDHLLGRPERVDFHRLFTATTRGQQCPELDRLGVKVMPHTRLMTGTEPGFWMPAWMWPIVRELLKQMHERKVAEGKASPLRSYEKPQVFSEWLNAPKAVQLEEDV